MVLRMNRMKVSRQARRIVWVALASALGLHGGAEAAGYHMPITFGGYSNRTEALTNFPVLVVLSNGVGGASGFNFRTMPFLSTNGWDLRFKTNLATTGTNTLNYEIETFNTSSAAYVWVQVPLIPTNGQGSVWATWGDSSDGNQLSCTTNGAVWANGFKSVWHLGEDPTGAVRPMRDSTTNRQDAANVRGVQGDSVQGMAGRGLKFNTTNYLITATNDFLDGQQTGTISAWFNTSAAGVLLSYYTLTDDQSGGGLSVKADGRMQYGIKKTSGGAWGMWTNVNPNVFGAWHHVAVVSDNAALNKIIVDGTVQAVTWAPSGQGGEANSDWFADMNGVSANNHFITLGVQKRSSESGGFSGLMDEMRYSSVARSTNWLWAECQIMASNSAFATYGPVQADLLPCAYNGIGATGVTTRAAWLNATLVSTGGSQTAWGVLWGTNNPGSTLMGWLGGGAQDLGVAATAGVSTSLWVTGLSPETTYYYAAWATNAAGTNVASPVAFTTLSVRPAMVNAGASNVADMAATVYGTLVSTGESETVTYVMYGTNAAALSATSVIGVSGLGSVSNRLTGLGPSTTYYYRFAASNAAGRGFAPTTNLFTTLAGTRYVNAANPTPASPFMTWETAATTIQDAVDAAGVGDQIIVTNGAYSTGGKAVYNGFTNRVCIDKALTVRSVNGPAFTTIVGQGPLGSNAVRCAYVASNAVLSGFTLTNGATRLTGNTLNEQTGGGAWCDPAGVISNCWVLGNSAGYMGGGVYYGVVTGCRIAGNYAMNGGGISGGNGYDGFRYLPTAPALVYNCVIENNMASQNAGAQYAVMNNCAVIGNRASSGVGGVYISILKNCTVAGNSARSYVGGLYFSVATNTIIYANSAPWSPDIDLGAYTDWITGLPRARAVLTRCCTPRVTTTNGTGNITNDPRFVSAWHIAPQSPCFTNGASGVAVGTDLDGDAWRSPPSIGCDEPWAAGATGALSVAIGADSTCVAVGSAASLTALIGGIAATSVWNFGDGTYATNRAYASHAWSTAGVYTVTLTAFNVTHPAGVATSLVMRVELPGIRYVNGASPSPTAPFTSWETAATTIQDAIDAAVEGDTVLVTNGVYAGGGRVMWASMNRVVVRKRVTVQSVNGPEATIIQGQGPAGPHAVRCAYLGTNAVLAGFTLANGATATFGDYSFDRSGGGIVGENGSVVSNCVIAGNQAFYLGGGAYGISLFGSWVSGNRAEQGGGLYSVVARNCVVERNTADNGGGASGGTYSNCVFAGNLANKTGGGIDSCQGAVNCTVVGNRSLGTIGGVGSGAYVNTIVYGNPALDACEYGNSPTFTFSCTTPLPPGSGNIAGPPALASLYRLAARSPCIGAGTNVAAGSTDLYGQPWATPPSIGAAEGAVVVATGGLSVAIEASATNVAVGAPVLWRALIQGVATRSEWTFGDGVSIANQPLIFHTWSVPGEYTVNLRVFNDDNPDGVGAVFRITVRTPVVHLVNAANPTPVYPYTNWATAATSIQDAVDAASDADTVLVTNGVYQTGGGRTATAYADSSSPPGTPNRVTIEKRIEVRSVNGAAATTIRGAGLTNGPGAMRCAYVGQNARLTGFTLEGGHTLLWTDPSYDGRAGGAYCERFATVSYCTIQSNEAYFSAGLLNGTADHCTIRGNKAQNGNGGGASAVTLFNSLVYGNNSYGLLNGAAYNCTVAGNTQGVYQTVMANCIVYGNFLTNAQYVTAATNCCTTPALTGPGCFSANPLFVSAASNDYRLNGASPCIDRGIEISGLGITNDLAGTARPLDGEGNGTASFDIGCYEFNPDGASVPPIPQAQSAVISSWAPSDLKSTYLGGLGFTSTVILASGASHGTVTTTNGWFHYVPANTNYQGADSFTWRMNYSGAGTSGVSATVTFSLTLRDGSTNDWFQWRYDEHRSASAPILLPPTLTLQWRRDIPVVPNSYNSYPDLEYCRPVQLGKTLFVPIHASDSLAAYDTDTGSNKWTFYASGAIRRPPVAMALTNGTNIVVVGSEDGNVYALNATDGALYWKFQAAPNANKAMGFGRLGSVWPVCMSPVASNGKLYFGAGFMPSWCLYLYCVDAASGAVVWRNDGQTVSSGQNSGIGPLTISTDHTKIYGANGKRNAWSLSAATGSYLGLLTLGACSFYVDGNGNAPYGGYRDAIYGQYNPSETIAITAGDRTITATIATGLGVAGTVGSLLAGDGKLFVTTAQGSIYCFGGTPPAKTNIYLNAPVALAATTDVWTVAANSMLSRADLKQGLALVWGVGSGRLVEELAQQGGSNLMVVAADPDPVKLRAIRVKMDAAGWSGSRVSTIEGNPMACGFAPYQAGLIASEDVNVAGWSQGQALPLMLYDSTRPFGGEIWLPTLNAQHAAIQNWLAATHLPTCGGAASYTVSQVTGFAGLGVDGFTRICRTGFPDSKLALRPPFRPVAFGEEYARNAGSLNLVPSPAISRGVKAPGGYGSGSTRDIYTWLPAPAAMTGYEPPGQANTVNGSVTMPATLTNSLYGVVETAPGIYAYGDCGNYTTYRNLYLNPGKIACVFEASVNYWGGWFIGDRGGCSWNNVMYRALAANGMLAMCGGDSGCGCGTAVGLNATQVAVVSAPGEETWLRVRDERSKQLIQEAPVKRVGVNFGGMGDLYVPEEQMLWTHYPSSGWLGQAGPLLSFGIRGTATRRYHHSAQMPRTQERDRRWVSASQLVGMNGITVYLATPIVAEAAATAPLLDGQLTEDCWTSLPAWRLNSSDARVMVRFDATNLYIGGYLNASLASWTVQRSIRVGLSSRANTGVRIALACSTQYGRESSVIGTNSWQGAYVDSSNRVSAEMAIPWSALTGAGIATNQLLMNFSVCGQRLNGASFQNQESLAYGLQYNEALEVQYFSPVYWNVATGSVVTLTPHELRLYFAEMDDLLPTQRVFDVSLQGVKVLTNLDVVAEAGGGRREIVKEFAGIMIADKLDIDFTAKAGQPMLSGVEIVEGTGTVSVVSDFAAWQQRHFGTTLGLSAAADGDYDRDGMNNGNEWLAGTDPTNALSRLGISGFGVQGSGGDLVLRWASAIGKFYAVDGSTNLMEGFPFNVESDIPATPDLNTKTIQVEQAAQEFFRVRLE